MHKTRMFSGVLNSEGAMAVILAGAEMGFGPVTSLTGIYFIKGKVSVSAGLMAAAIKRSGRYDYRIKTLTDQRCAIEFFEHGQSIGTSEFTIQDAAKAGLAGGDNWTKYPRNMLFARALSNGAKWFTPDIFGAQVYVPGEIEGETDAIDAAWTPAAAGPATTPVEAASPPASPEPADTPTLDELVERFGAERVIVAAEGSIPASAEEVAAVAAKLAGEPDAAG